MKILYLYKDYYPVLGGVENYVKQLAEDMQQRGHEVEVLVTNTDRSTKQEIIEGVPVLKTERWVNISSAPLSPFMPVEYLKRRISKARPDIVHLQTPYPPGEFTWLLGNLGSQRPRSVITYHSDIVRQKKLLLLYGPILRQVLKNADRILPTSPQYIQSSPWLRPNALKCRVVPIGVDVERFAAAAPAKLPVPEGAPVILFAGRLRYYKGLQFLLDAMPQVKAEARLVIVGVGPMEAELKAQATRLNLQERVIFAGEVSDAELPGYYKAANLFVLPSHERSEAYGIVQLEAMAAGLPVVCTELGTGTSYINLNEETGLVVPPANPTALATAINRLLADPTLAQEMGKRGQARVRTRFTHEAACNRVEEVYMELSSSFSSGR